MIPKDEFVPLVYAAIPRFEKYHLNQHQESCVLRSSDEPLMIVAGPGSGKTTVLVLRALRLVLVDGLYPEEVVLTTFTRKAASELRARLIEWGLALVDFLKEQELSDDVADWLKNIDVNRFVTGTLDSICEDSLSRYRDPSDTQPVLVEGFVANAELMFRAMFPQGAHQNADLDSYLSRFTFSGNPPSNFGEKLALTRTIIDRLVHDQVDKEAFRNAPEHTVARRSIVDIEKAYSESLQSGSRMDFARLEELFYERLSTGKLNRLVDSVRALLVDEYQDTNPLQESIYFELIRKTCASLTIVGDDDQSLYRFRGATVELFRDFVARFESKVSAKPGVEVEYLVENYRSTPEVVEYFNSYVQADPNFAPARVQPPKPIIRAQLPSNGIPVLGMFRPDIDTLADDLSSLLVDVFRRGGRAHKVNDDEEVRLECDPDAGDFGDCVFLGHTVNEYAAAYGNNPPRARLPRLLRERFSEYGLSVFNPRGRSLRDIDVVQRLLGIILECIDPNRAQQEHLRENNRLRGDALRYLNRWRDAGREFVESNPRPNVPHTLAEFVAAWQARTPQSGMQWPDEWPLLELMFKVIAWIPELHDDPEGQVYLEAVARAISQAATFSAYRSTIIHNNPVHDSMSVKKAITDIFAPIAESAIDIDEDIMTHVPRDRLQFMTIHQAKGLEFPFVIVDVSSDYRTNNVRQRFKRFPEEPSAVQNLEDELSGFCEIGPLRQARSGLERTFDDLMRLYYVAYSRPQSVLLLVGLDSCLRYSTTIKHVATGWLFDGVSWGWRSEVAGRKPSLANNIPISLI